MYGIGTSSGPYSVYARSSHEILTGDRIEIEIPIEWRMSEVSNPGSEVTSFKINPNPSNLVGLHLVVEDMQQGELYFAHMLDAFGKEVYKIEIGSDGMYPIKSHLIVDGLYYLSIQNSKGGVVHTSKVVVIE